jgi:hypothetical protein|tara:strand:- start:526 stop:1653 length:1128 start_codon:yes stop_codon:yes gene_type:complete
MKSDDSNFILNLMDKIKYEIKVDIPLEKINFVNKTKIYKKNINTIQNYNFDNLISSEYNDNIDNILNDNLSIKKFINTNFYEKNLISNFVSTRVLRDIINNIIVKTTYIMNNRKIIIFSKTFIKDKLINKIDSILNFFNYLTNKNNFYEVQIYLSDEKKKINSNHNFLGPDNINSGLTLPGHYIILFRKEEMIKVLFHELIHYLDLDMRNYQKELFFLYDKVNLKADIINPNEGYTEILALILLNIWESNYKNIKINNFLEKKLNFELYWSFIQITKILKFFNYKSFDKLFKNENIFYQKTNVLSYFFFKTILLLNINSIFKDLTLDNLYINKNRFNIIKNNSDLKDLKEYIDIVYQEYDTNKFDKNTLRMTFFG